jgi:hypothetical protein
MIGEERKKYLLMSIRMENEIYNKEEFAIIYH